MTESHFGASMSIVRLDNVQSLVNIATGQGTNQYDPFNHDTLKNDGVAFLDQNTQAHLRRQHKILRKLIETIPNQMTFRWGQITLGGEDAEDNKELKNEVEQWLADLPTRTVYNEYRGVAAAFNQAQKAANETGNAALILMADDGQATDAPLKKIKSLDGLFLADRWAIKPDVSGLAFGITAGIQHYILTSQGVLSGLQLVSSNGQPLGIGNVKIHKSRVLWFRGEELSDRSLQMNFGCDDSVLEGVYRSFREYDKAIRGAGRMLVDFDIYVHYIKNYLERAMADGSEAKVFEQKMHQRLQANSLSRSSWRGMTADLEEEKIETITRNVSGYGDLIDRILADFLSNTDLQPSELLQKYPDGLAATGKTEQQNSNDRTRLYQSNKFDSNIRKLLKIAFLLKGKEPEVWDWAWNELYPTTPVEQSELELNWAQIDSSRIQSGVYSPDDAAKSHYGTPEFNPHITIDFKAREKAMKEAEQQALEQAQQAPEADPTADPNAEEQDPELVFDSADQMVPPKIVQDAAKQGMLIRRSLPDGVVPARVSLLGRKLSMGDVLTDFERTSLSAYHQSHRKPPAVLKNDAETAMYLLHGGLAGTQWVKQLSAPSSRADGMGDAPNFRDSAQRACGNCVHFETKGRNNAGWEGCGLYGFRASRRSLCDSYKAMYASLEPEPSASPQLELLRLENENLKMRLTLSERDDGVHPAGAEEIDKPLENASRTDDDTPIKRTIFWKGFEIGLQYQPFDLRHEKLLPCGYGEIVGTNGQDGMALDCYVGSGLESDRVFVVDQLNAQTGEFDEHKLFIGFDDDAATIKDLFVSLMGQERFGGIKETVPAKVWDLHEDSEHFDKRCGKGYIAELLQCHKDPVADELRSEFSGGLETFINAKGEKRWLPTQAAATTYQTINTGGFPPGLIGQQMGGVYRIAVGAVGTLDINQALAFPVEGVNAHTIPFDEQVEWNKAILKKALPFGGIVTLDSDGFEGGDKRAKQMAEALGLKKAEFKYDEDTEAPVSLVELRRNGGFTQRSLLGSTRIKDFVKNSVEPYEKIYIGKYSDGKITPVTKHDVESIDAIRKLRQNLIAPLVVGDPNTKQEEKTAAELAKIEDAYLGRKPTKIKSLATYEAKAKKWAEEQFGKVEEGANGFSLQQTLAHDVAHPIVHEMLKSSTDRINKRFGSTLQNDGRPSLVLEEAIVNVAEHLSRGDSIEASILNGLRLAKVLSRNKEVQSDAVRAQVRDRAFTHELAKMSHELYRHKNFSLYMKYIRETNRISGTVTQAGDDFTNSASGG
jgi:hypothetical protein